MGNDVFVRFHRGCGKGVIPEFIIIHERRAAATPGNDDRSGQVVTVQCIDINI